jgi:DNA-binding transcriptional MerR regulator
MPEMTDPPRRKMTPGPAGLQIPPRRDSPDSLPAYDREVIALWLREIKSSQERVEERLPQIEQQLAQHTDELRELRESSTIAREVRQELREQSQQIATLARDVRAVVRSDASQEVDLGKLEAEIRKTASSQTRATALKFGVPGAVITILVALAEQWIPALAGLFR